MTIALFSKRSAVLAAVGLFILMRMSASAPAEDYEPMEDVAKLEKPTVCYDGEEGLYLVDWDGQNNRLWIKGVFNGPARWSPDGNRASMLAGLGYIHYILDLQTGRMINVTKLLDDKGVDANTYYYSGAWWFPDGKRLACRGDVIGGPSDLPDIYILDTVKLTYENITNTPERDESWISVSPDGEKIAFSAGADTPDGKYDPKSPDEIFVMDADGSNIVNLTNSPAYERYPEWSPDGKKIAFEAAKRPEQVEGGIDIYVMDADGSNVQQLTTFEIGKWKSPGSWSPNSKWLLFAIKKDNGVPYDVYRVHVETKEIVRITHGVNSSNASWVLAGRSRFLSVDPADQKKAQWGKIKAASGNENSPAPQESSSDEE